MRASRTGALALGASLAIGVAACGSSGSSDNSSSTSAKTTTQQGGTTTTKTGKGGLTPAGTKLSAGQTATVDWAPPSLSLKGDNKVIKLQVTVESLEKGSQSDLKGVQLDKDQQGATPFFLNVRLKNLGTTPPKSDDPDTAFHAIDDRGQEQGSVTFIGDFPRCEDVTVPKPFGKGKGYDSCLTYLVKGGSIKEVRWKDGPAPKNGVSEYFEKPVVWSLG